MRPRLCSKSMDKLAALCQTAEVFIQAGGLGLFSEIEIQLTWDYMDSDPDDGVEAVIAPIIIVKLRRERKISMSKAHPGFKAVQAKVEKKEGVSKAAAGRIVGYAKAHASAAAKKANPRLKRTGRGR